MTSERLASDAIEFDPPLDWRRLADRPARKFQIGRSFLVRVVAVGEALELVVQSLGADAQDFRGAGLVAGSKLDRARDHFFLDIVERAAQRNLDEAAVSAARRAEVVGQIEFANRPALAHDQRAL